MEVHTGYIYEDRIAPGYESCMTRDDRRRCRCPCVAFKLGGIYLTVAFRGMLGSYLAW